MANNNQLIIKAVALIELIEKKNNKYALINKDISKIQPDFPSHVQFMDHEVFDNVINYLDIVLGDQLASYYIFESSPRKISIKDKKKEVDFNLNNIKELKQYLSYKHNIKFN